MPAELNALQTIGRAPPLPLTLTLPQNAGVLTITHLLRVLPGQRYVGRAEWQGRVVLAKLLVGPKAQVRYVREREGAHLLQRFVDTSSADFPVIGTPRLLAEGFAAGQGGWLLFEFLDAAESLETLWQNAPPDERASLLRDALQAFAALYRQGYWQADLHLDNLLRCRGRLYLIDGGDMRADKAPLAPEKRLENLGVFLAQLDRSLPFFPALLEQSGIFDTPLLPAQWDALKTATARARHWRARDLMKKIRRDCSSFAVARKGWLGAFGFSAFCRQDAEMLAPILADPDAFIAQGQLYKTGGSATVARIDLAGRTLVIKRYNIKHFWHALKRCWRPSRAWRAWREGHRLLALGIPTARPLAVLERRYCGLRGVAYLITEHLDGPDLMATLERFGGTLPAPRQAALESLLNALVQERISHGDMKGHNLIWISEPGAKEKGREDAAGHWALIDLDAMRQHGFPPDFTRAHRRDARRLAKNGGVQTPAKD